MSEARTWLPSSALEDGRSAASVERVLRAWIERWFPEGCIDSVAVSATAPIPCPGTALVEPFEGAAIAWQPETGIAWARAALGHQGKGGLTAADREVLSRLALRIRDELSAALSELFQAPPAAAAAATPSTLRGRAWRVAAAGKGSSPLVELWIGEPRMAALRRSLCGRFDPPPVEPVEIGRAAARCEAEVVARLGSARVSLSELRDLAPGDLLVLDRRVDEPVRIERPEGGRLLLADLVGDEVSMVLKAR